MNTLLDKTSRRILGALIEKRWTTPEQFPLTLNALVLACNQKSNRDPEMEFEQGFVEGCVYQLRVEGLLAIVERDTGRSVRYDERLSEKLDLSRSDQAVVAELLLRGPQTAPELFRRCERMAHFENVEQVEGILRGFASKGWTELMPRESGQRHARWRHLFAPSSESDSEALEAPEAPTRTAEVHASPMAAAPAPSAPVARPDPLVAFRAEIDALRAEVARLRERVDRLDA